MVRFRTMSLAKRGVHSAKLGRRSDETKQVSVVECDGRCSPSAAMGDPQRLRSLYTWLAVATMTALAAGVLIVLSNRDVLFAVIIAISLIPVAVGFLLIRRNHLEASMILLALSMFATITLLGTKGLGIHHLTNLGFPAVLLLSSLVMRRRTQVALAAIAVACVAWLVFGELAGAYTPQTLTRSVPGDFFTAVLMIVVTVLFASVLSKTLFTNHLALLGELRKRENTEEALRASEEHYRMLFDSISEGFAFHEIICDEAGTPINYKFLEINRAFEKLTGLRANEAVGRTVLDVLPTTESHWMEDYGKVALTGEPSHFASYHSGLGKHFEVHAFSTKKGYFAAVFEDITERVQREEERERLIAELRKTLSDNKVLHGLLPICAGCKKIRDDKGYWNQLEKYISSHTAAEFSHGLCPDCVRKYYPDVADTILKTK